MEYKVITKEIVTIKGNNALLATYVYSLIKYYENFKTNVSEVTLNTLAKFANVDISTIEKIIANIKKNKAIFLNVQTKQISGIERHNYYTFHKEYENYFYIENDFFKIPLKGISDELQSICKGFLLRLKAICQNETNTYWNGKRLNKSKLAENMGLSRPTLNKYLDILINSDNLKILENGELFINNKYIVPDFIKSDAQTEIYHSIFKYSIDNNIVPPKRDNEQLKRLAANFPNREIKDRYNFGYLLNNRCLKDTNYSYLLKALLNKDIEINELNTTL